MGNGVKVSFSIWENFAHISPMDNIEQLLWIHSHQDKTAISEV